MIKEPFKISVLLTQNVDGISGYITTFNKYLLKYINLSKIFSLLLINYHLEKDKNTIYFLET